MEETKQVKASEAKALSARPAKVADNTVWTADSGATKHMTPSRNKMINVREFNSGVQIADGKFVDAIGIGDVPLKLSNTCAVV